MGCVRTVAENKTEVEEEHENKESKRHKRRLTITRVTRICQRLALNWNGSSILKHMLI